MTLIFSLLCASRRNHKYLIKREPDLGYLLGVRLGMNMGKCVSILKVDWEQKGTEYDAVVDALNVGPLFFSFVPSLNDDK